MKKEHSVQDVISLGYIYLIFVGLFSNLIFYKFLGINILNYSDVMDLILTPINILTSNVVSIITTIVLIILGFILMKKHSKAIVAIPIMVFIFFLGIGVGSGLKVNSKIQKNEIVASHTITFIDGKTKSIQLIGQTGSYLFYIAKDEKEVTVTPIANTIITITKISK